MSDTFSSSSTDGPALRTTTATEVATADMTLYGDCARVLANTGEMDRFEQTETAVFCPNCGSILTSYEHGLPPVGPYFEGDCSTCEVELQPWCVVAVTASNKDIVNPAVLPELTRAYWNQQFWTGITTKHDDPRKHEYSRFTKKAAAFGWAHALNCPLCRRPLTDRRLSVEDGCDEVDYHCWSHTPDQGITLCHDCHDAISFGKQDAHLEDQADEWGFNSSDDLQIVRLALREAHATNQPLRPKMAPRLINRYNLTQVSNKVTELIRTVLEDDKLRDRFIDDLLFQGLPVDD